MASPTRASAATVLVQQLKKDGHAAARSRGPTPYSHPPFWPPPHQSLLVKCGATRALAAAVQVIPHELQAQRRRVQPV